MVAGALFGHATILTNFFVALLEFIAMIFVLRAARRVDPVWIVSIALVTTPLQAHEIGLPISPHRILIPAALLVLILRMPGARIRPNLEFRPVHALLAIGGVYVILSALSTGTLLKTEAFYTMTDRFGLLSFALFFVAPVLFRTKRQQGILIAFMVALGAYLGILALLETAHAYGLVWPRYIANPNFGDNFGRARGPFVESQANGLAMFQCAVFAGLGYARWRGWPRLLAGGVAALLVLGVLLTLTRGAWLGAGAGVIVTMLLFRQLRPYLLPIGLTCIIGLGGALVVSPGLRKKVFNRASNQATVYARQGSDSAAVNMLKAKPLLGFGWYSFKQKSGPYFKDGKDYSLQSVDTTKEVPNVFLSNAAELGLLGGGLWLWGVLAAFGGAIFRRGPPELVPWRMAACAVGIAWLVVSAFSVTDFSFPCFVAWIVAGIAGGS
ncbi:MAG: O-antigen ligase family protein, partial [Solirubrobacterales bacterium]|nr:O-antigen ligase family protein [Solirubrobacterales bacterium]